MEDRLCCVINTQYICDGCGMRWCNACAQMDRWEANNEYGHDVLTKEAYMSLGHVKYKCPGAGIVYSTSAVLSGPNPTEMPIHLVVKEP